MIIKMIYSKRFHLPRYTLVILLVVSYVAVSGGGSAGFNVFGHFIPDSYCANVINGTQENFTEVQHEIMMPKSDLHPTQHNCRLNDQYNTSKCDTYTFDRRLMKETISTKYGLVCEKSNINSLLTSVMAFTNTIAPIPAGFCSDKFGRMKTIKYLFLLFCSSLMVTISVSDNLIVYEITRMIQCKPFLFDSIKPPQPLQPWQHLVL